MPFGMRNRADSPLSGTGTSTCQQNYRLTRLIWLSMRTASWSGWRTSGLLLVAVLGLTDATGMRDRIRVTANSDPRGNEGDDQDRTDHRETHIGRDVGYRRVHAMGEGEDQLDADEDKDDREAQGEVDELVE